MQDKSLLWQVVKRRFYGYIYEEKALHQRRTLQQLIEATQYGNGYWGKVKGE